MERREFIAGAASVVIAPVVGETSSKAGDWTDALGALWRAIPGLPAVVPQKQFVNFFLRQGDSTKAAVTSLANAPAPSPVTGP